MDIKIFFNQKKVAQNKKFQKNLNDLGEKLAKCKTVQEVQKLKTDPAVTAINNEINDKQKKRKSDSKEPLQAFKPKFNNFFESSDSKSCEEFIKACNKLQEDGADEKVSEIAAIKNINMTKLIDGIKTYKENINNQINDITSTDTVNMQGLKKSGRENDKTLQNISKDGNISGGEDDKIDNMIIDIVNNLDLLFGGEIKENKIINNNLKKLNQIKDDQQKEILEKLINCIENISKRKKFKSNDIPKVNKLIEQLNSILKLYENMEKKLKHDGQMATNAKNELKNEVDNLIKLIKEIFADGTITEEEQEALEKQVDEVIDSLPMTEEKQEELKESAHESINDIHQDGSNFKKSVNKITNTISEAVPKSTEKVIENIVEKPLNQTVQETQDKIDEHNEENKDGNGEGTAGEKAIEDFISALNGSKFFDDVANANTVAEAHEKIKNCAQNIFKCFDKLPNPETVKKTFPELYVWCENFTKGLYEISSKLENFGRFQTHITVLQNLSKKMPALKNCANSLHTSYTAALNKIEELKQKQEAEKKATEELEKKRKEDILQEFKNLKIVQETMTKSRRAKNGPKAIDVYNSGNIKDLLEDTTGNVRYGYILVNAQGEKQYEKLYPHSVNSINSSNKDAGSQVQKFLKAVVEHGKWPASKEEAKEWVK